MCHSTFVISTGPFQRSLLASAPGPVLDFGPERGPGKGTMADLGPLIRHLVSTRLPSGGRAAFVVGYSWTVVAGSWGRSRLLDRYPWLWRYVVVNQGCVDRVADSYGGSYVSQVFAVVGQSVTASRYVDCVIPCKSVEVEERLGPCWSP